MRLVISALILLFATAATAETRYVDDDLVITMRTGQGTTYQIVKSLHSGTPLEVLEEGEQYTRVRTSDGIEGWVLSRYLSKTPIARDRLVRAEKRISQLQADKQELQKALNELKQEKGSVEKEQQNLSAESEKLRQELEHLRKVAARPIELERQKNDLQSKQEQLQSEIEQLKSDNARLEDRTQREWFITGASVLFGGILLGVFLPMLRRKKKTGMFD